MDQSLKTKINLEFKKFAIKRIASYKLNSVNKTLPLCIKEFILRDGKRIRPILFVLSYLGYAKNKKITKGLLKTAFAFELLHDFLLVHDDIIDNSFTRRGKPTMHRLLQQNLKVNEKTGRDLSIIVGDIIFCMALNAFSSIRVSPMRKQEALNEFIKSTLLTGAGEFQDVLNAVYSLNKINLYDIRTNYVLKTAEYTFKAPLLCGAILAGANKKESKNLACCAILLGKAFQIQDDLIGIFGKSRKIGKSVLSDISEAKKTLPIFLAYKKATKTKQKFIASCLGNSKLRYCDLQAIRKIIIDTGALNTCKDTIKKLMADASQILNMLKLNQEYKQSLSNHIYSFIDVLK